MQPVARPNRVINCPLTAAWAAVGGKWKLTIIYWLGEQPRHDQFTVHNPNFVVRTPFLASPSMLGDLMTESP